MNAKVTVTSRKLNNLATAIDIQGEINAFAESVLMEAFAQATTDGSRFVLLNFSGLEYMNSSGIGLLVTILIRANRQKQRLFAYGLTEHYRQIFELTRLNEAILIFSSETEALASAV